jgi:hypothetical protein
MYKINKMSIIKLARSQYAKKTIMNMLKLAQEYA